MLFSRQSNRSTLRPCCAWWAWPAKRSSWFSHGSFSWQFHPRALSILYTLDFQCITPMKVDRNSQIDLLSTGMTMSMERRITIDALLWGCIGVDVTFVTRRNMLLVFFCIHVRKLLKEKKQIFFFLLSIAYACVKWIHIYIIRMFNCFVLSKQEPSRTMRIFHYDVAPGCLI